MPLKTSISHSCTMSTLTCACVEAIGLYSGGQHVASDKAVPLQAQPPRIWILRQRLIHHQQRHLCCPRAGPSLARFRGWCWRQSSEQCCLPLLPTSAVLGTPAPSDAAALALDISAPCDPCRDRAVSLAAVASAASSIGTLHHPFQETRCASHASSRRHLMVKRMQH